ncbi:MAG TPA: GerMN domain-containing protein [Granulicella sp.]
MIPRYQRILFYTLAVMTLLLAAFTIRERQKAQEHITAINSAMPYVAPVDAQTESVTLDLANDADGTILSALRDAALPKEPSLRAHALLERLFSEYNLPDSPHPLTTSPAVDDVFLLTPPVSPNAPADLPHGQLAVVNLRAAFADAHPSGVLVEVLTLQSIVGTLHANLPQIAQVRFLVDGQQRETLAGHADLTHAYPAVDTAATLLQPTHPIEHRQ